MRDLAQGSANSNAVLTRTRIQAGRWEGVLKTADGDPPPRIAVLHLGLALPDAEITPLPDRPGRWRVSVPIPAELLSDGVQTFLICDPSSGRQLGQFTIVTGVPLEDDIRAELDLLRAELDLLKKAFRRHLRESGS